MLEFLFGYVLGSSSSSRPPRTPAEQAAYEAAEERVIWSVAPPLMLGLGVVMLVSVTASFYQKVKGPDVEQAIRDYPPLSAQEVVAFKERAASRMISVQRHCSDNTSKTFKLVWAKPVKSVKSNDPASALVKDQFNRAARTQMEVC